MNWLKTKQVRNRLLYTIGILIIFQMGTFLTLPGITINNYSENSSPLATLLNLTSGGTLSRFGILALGVSPFVTASIIVQILSKGLSKKYTELQEQGALGNQKLAHYTRRWSLIIGFISGLTILFTNDLSLLLSVVIKATFWEKIILSAILSVGSLFVSYLAEQINKNGIGNGQSLIITTGILTTLPQEIATIFNPEQFVRSVAFYQSVAIMAITLLGIGIVTYLANKKEYRLPIHSKQSLIKTNAHYVPIKLLASSVVPIIFATSTLTIASTVYFLVKQSTLSWFDYEQWNGMFIYAILIFIFTYLYNYVQVDSSKMAKDLAKSGVYIIGISNKETEKYINSKIIRISNIGAPILTILATISIIVAKLSPINLDMTLTGVSILLIVSTFQELIHQIKGLTQKHNYKELI